VLFISTKTIGTTEVSQCALFMLLWSRTVNAQVFFMVAC